jgi:hypothetical protein
MLAVSQFSSTFTYQQVLERRARREHFLSAPQQADQPAAGLTVS